VLVVPPTVGVVAGVVGGAGVDAAGVVAGGVVCVGDAVCVAGWVVGGAVVGCVVWAVADDGRTPPTLVPDELLLAGVDPTVAVVAGVLLPDCELPT
jgi:hypothetical protein